MNPGLGTARGGDVGGIESALHISPMTEFTDNVSEARFEWREDGVVSFADYAERGNVRAVLHVETPAAARGRGAAGRLMDAIIADARARGFKLQPVCGYAVAHFRRYPETRDVLA